MQKYVKVDPICLLVKDNWFVWPGQSLEKTKYWFLMKQLPMLIQSKYLVERDKLLNIDLGNIEHSMVPDKRPWTATDFRKENQPGHPYQALDDYWFFHFLSSIKKL